MKRRLLGILAVVSALLFAATLVVWLAVRLVPVAPPAADGRPFAAHVSRRGLTVHVARPAAARPYPHGFTYADSMFASRADGVVSVSGRSRKMRVDDLQWDGSRGHLRAGSVELVEADGGRAGLWWRRGLRSTGRVNTVDGTWALAPWGSVTIAYPYLLALFALPALLLLPGHIRRRRAARRAAAGLCRGCGYDLRGGAGSDRCPECGRAAVAAGSVMLSA